MEMATVEIEYFNLSKNLPCKKIKQLPRILISPKKGFNSEEWKNKSIIAIVTA